MQSKTLCQFFLPGFPVKTQKKKPSASKKTITAPVLKITKKQCEDLLLNSNRSSKQLLDLKRQNTFAEPTERTVTPLRLKRIEILLPKMPEMSGRKIKSRNSKGLSYRRRSVDNKNSRQHPLDMPSEITTTRCSVRINSANATNRIRRIQGNLSKSTNLTRSMIRSHTNMSNTCNSCAKHLVTE